MFKRSIFKIVIFILIQAILLSGVVWAGQFDMLSPSLNIDKIQLKNILALAVQDKLSSEIINLKDVKEIDVSGLLENFRKSLIKHILNRGGSEEKLSRILEQVNMQLYDFVDEHNDMEQRKWGASVRKLYGKIFADSDSLGDDEHMALLTKLLRKSRFSNIAMPLSLKQNIIKNRTKLNETLISEIITGRVGVITIKSLKDILELSLEEEKYLWKIFHKTETGFSNRNLEDMKRDCKQTFDHIDQAIGNWNKPEKLKVLDLGCGPKGTTIKDIKKKYGQKIDAFGINLVLSDAAGSDLGKRGKDATYVNLKEGDAKNMPFPDGYFDLIYEIGLTEYHLGSDEFEEIIAEIVRVLSPGGKCIISWVYQDWIIERIDGVLQSTQAGLQCRLHEDRLTVTIEKRDTSLNRLMYLANRQQQILPIETAI
ncbi:MAG: class I SAM-dependent methyltransferase [Candidatus Omnitrophota bacterium]